MIEHIPELLDAGIDSFKIEGRMKTALYVATVARTYRKAIDDYFVSPEQYQDNLPYYREEISKCTYRQFTTGFFFGKPTHETQIYDSNTYVREYTYLGRVESVLKPDVITLTQRNKFSVGEKLEVMMTDGSNALYQVMGIWDEAGQEMEAAPHPKQKVSVRLQADTGESQCILKEGLILRKKEEN